jgi:cell division protease FtsH
VVVGLPDVTGREQILRVHARKAAVGDDVDLKVLARGTPGFSGADLANLVNEAALMAARAGKRSVDMHDFEQAKDKILMGTERRSLAMGPEEKRLTAYHEAGHTILGRLLPEHDPVHKVTIIPRGRALGVTVFLPEKDRVSASKRFLESQITSLFGGRVAEELIYGREAVTTGAQNDIERATAIARNMVTRWGYSEKLGPLAYQEDEGEVFLGRSVTRHKHASDETARQIDEEVRAIIDRNYERARTMLTGRLDTLHAMAAALVEHETLSSEQIDDIMAGRAPRGAPPRDHGGGGVTPAGNHPAARPLGPALPGTG